MKCNSYRIFSYFLPPAFSAGGRFFYLFRHRISSITAFVFGWIFFIKIITLHNRVLYCYSHIFIINTVPFNSEHFRTSQSINRCKINNRVSSLCIGKPHIGIKCYVKNKVAIFVQIYVKAKSLKVFMYTYKPDYAIKLSAKNFGIEDNKKIVPLYAAFCI